MRFKGLILPMKTENRRNSTKKTLSQDDVKVYLGINVNDTMAKIFVTPEQALYLLEKCNRVNRRLNRQYVESLIRDMESEHWYSDTDHIGFDKTGLLINGQHRLRALSKSNIKGLFLKFDFDVEQHVSMDTGNSRTYCDQVNISKKLHNEILPNKYRGIICAGVKLSNPEISLSNSELAEIWIQYGDKIKECDTSGLFDLGSCNSMVVKSSLLWAYISGISMDILSNMSSVLKNGITHEDTDIPIIRLRDYLIALHGNGKDINIKRAKFTQQCIYNIAKGRTSGRLPSNPLLHYQDYPFLDFMNNENENKMENIV